MKIVEINDTVKVLYTCITCDGQRYSSYNRRNPHVINVIESKMFKAIEEVVTGAILNFA